MLIVGGHKDAQRHTFGPHFSKDIEAIQFRHGLVQSRLAGREDVLVIERCWEIDRLMAATDVAITKMNRITIFELHQLMVPNIALSFDLNPIDDQAVSGLEGVLRIAAKDLRPEELRAAIHTLAGSAMNGHCQTGPGGAEKCARFLDQALRRGLR